MQISFIMRPRKRETHVRGSQRDGGYLAAIAPLPEESEDERLDKNGAEKIAEELARRLGI